MTPYERIERLEKKMVRIEGLLWYVAGAMSLKFGSDLLPLVAAIIK